jgi:PBP1b-binding outer membrane lipoprotein LpoB
VRILVYTTVYALLLHGCSGYTFEPENSAPKNEHEAFVKAQQSALIQQQQVILNE